MNYKRYVGKEEDFTNNWVKAYELIFESYRAREFCLKGTS